MSNAPMSDAPSLRAVLERGRLIDAWLQVRANKGAPGVDEVTVARWERNWEENLDRLSQMVRTNTYRPNRPRRFKVVKPDGGWREFSILTVSDRVLQRAMLNALEPPFEVGFLEGSYGYRPGRGVAQAVEQVLHWRDQGYGWVFDADIESCFDNLDHAVILEGLRQVVRHPLLLRLMELWLEAGRKSKSQTPTAKSAKSQTSQAKEQNSKVGIPLGAVISPLWCNIVLHQLDLALERAGWKWARYADDFVVCTRTHAEALQVWQETEAALAGIHLKLNEEKTRITTFERGFKFLGVTFKGDTYAFIYEGKRFEVRGRNVTVLWNHLPEPYGWKW